MIRGLLSLAACACLAFAASTAKPVIHGQYNAQTDAQIEQTIKAKLAKSKIGLDHFKIRVQGGVAYWEGNTNVIQHKGAATRMARTAGARNVINNIQISDAARQKARENLDGGRRRAQVKRGESRSDPRTEAARSK